MAPHICSLASAWDCTVWFESVLAELGFQIVRLHLIWIAALEFLGFLMEWDFMIVRLHRFYWFSRNGFSDRALVFDLNGFPWAWFSRSVMFRSCACIWFESFPMNLYASSPHARSLFCWNCAPERAPSEGRNASRFIKAVQNTTSALRPTLLLCPAEKQTGYDW